MKKKRYVNPDLKVLYMTGTACIASVTGETGYDNIGYGGADEGGMLDPDANSRGDWEEDFWDSRE